MSFKLHSLFLYRHSVLSVEDQRRTKQNKVPVLKELTIQEGKQSHYSQTSSVKERSTGRTSLPRSNIHVLTVCWHLHMQAIISCKILRDISQQ